jgi:hypothetical protein
VIGCSTCASASAHSFDAQPAQLERVVRRTSRPEVAFSDINVMPSENLPLIQTYKPGYYTVSDMLASGFGCDDDVMCVLNYEIRCMPL